MSRGSAQHPGRQTKRQWFALNPDQYRCSHETRTFTAKDMRNNAQEHTVDSTTMKAARRYMTLKLGHTCFILTCGKPGFWRRAA